MTLTVIPRGIYSGAMPWKWAALRSEFIRQRGAKSQAQVAHEADLHQSAISKLENNDNLGPAVEVFLNAIDGLGLPASKFFADLERSQKQALQSGKSLGDTASSPSGEAASDGVGSLSAASEKAALRQLRIDFRKLEADLRRMEARDRDRTAARRKKTPTREGVRARRKRAS